MLTLKQKLEILCKINNITLTTLAEAVGVSKSTVARWDKAIPNGDTLLKLSEYFHVTPDSLLNKSVNIVASSETNGKASTQEFIDLLDLLNLSAPACEIAKDMLISIKRNVDR